MAAPFNRVRALFQARIIIKFNLRKIIAGGDQIGYSWVFSVLNI